MRKLLLAGFLVVVFGEQAFAEVFETRKVKNYQFGGASIAEARANMKKAHSFAYDASTDYYIDWLITYQVANGRCSVVATRVDLAITFTMPDLRTSDAALDRSFKDYLAKLQNHEDGHADIARTAAREVNDSFSKLSATTCDELDRKAEALVQSIVKEADTRNIKYDKKTDHGRTQGARWP